MRPDCAHIALTHTTQFAREAHLRDFLKQNLHQIEPGLHLYRTHLRDGVEFPVGRGRIDLLALDRHEQFVAIELKRSRTRSKTLGQLLHYMAWIDSNLANPRNSPCRGIIIANQISPDLQAAASLVPRVSLAQYTMTLAINPIPTLHDSRLPIS